MCSSEIYYVVFKEAERKHWALKFLKKGFSHCYIMKAEGAKWLKYEAGYGLLRADLMNDREVPSDVSAIISVVRRDHKTWASLNTCVGAVKRLAGIKGLSLTPWQLYKRLTK